MRKKVLIIVTIVSSILVGGNVVFAYLNSRKKKEVE